MHAPSFVSAIAVGALLAGLLPAIGPRRSCSRSSIGVTLGEITPVTAAALVSAGLLSVIVFPLVAVTLLRSTDDEALPVAAPAR